jgi:coproporphyrinogen III oxidase
MAAPMRQQVEEYVHALQDKIVSALEDLDPDAPKFRRDPWTRPQGGSGRSCVFSIPSSSSTARSTVLEKAGVGVSVVHGVLPPGAIKQMRSDHSSIPYDPDSAASLPFFAAGISLIVHPRNPSAPTVHANYRYFELLGSSASDPQTDVGGETIIAWWFGGGSDLTPSYLFDDDAVHFHTTLKDACDQHAAALYPSFKAWCDEYFFIPHRRETRGIGGIFFDDLNDHDHKRLVDNDTAPRPRSPAAIFALVKSLGDAFLPSYLPILQRRMSMPSDEHKRRWQLLRRGRYVEFNLVYDRGTKFGLNTPGARIESILMSLPETARWEYMSDVEGVEGSEEDRLVQCLKNPRTWV